MPRYLWVLSVWGLAFAFSPVLINSLRSEEARSRPKDDASLWQRAGWIESGIFDGRLLAKVLHHGHGRVSNSESDELTPEVLEALELRADDSNIHLHYVREAENYSYLIHVTDERSWHVIEESPQSGKIVCLKQPEQGHLVFTIRDKRGVETYRGETIWHLLLGRNSRCRNELTRLLEPVLENENLQSQMSETASLLLEETPSPTLHVSWQKWVADLGAEEFSTRQEADRSLRLAGRPVLWELARIDQTRLDAEQRGRIRRILRECFSEQNDVPSTIAGMVQADLGVWINLLEQADGSQNALASERIEKLLQHPQGNSLLASDQELQRRLESLRQRHAQAPLTWQR